MCARVLLGRMGGVQFHGSSVPPSLRPLSHTPQAASSLPHPLGTFRHGEGVGPERKVRRRLRGVAPLPVAARAQDSESKARGAAAGPWQGQAGRATGDAMRGTRAAPCRPRPRPALALLPLLVLLFHWTRPQGKFWSELVSGDPPRARP